MIQIDEQLFETIQHYWNLYLRGLPDEVKIELPVDFGKIINEINQNSIRSGFFDEYKEAKPKKERPNIT